MKNKRKTFFYASFILTTPGMIALSISCSKKTNSEDQLPETENNKNDEKIVKDYINKLSPKLKPEKKDVKAKTSASTISTEEQVKDWFDGLPESNSEINVKFISSSPLTTNKTILEIKYEISKGSITREFKYLEEGFLDESSSNKDENDVKDFISKLKPSIKTDKKDQKANTLASTINTEELVKQWFDGLPQSNEEINVEFVSSTPKTEDDSILEIKYNISKGKYTETYTFKEDGFKLKANNLNFKEFSEKNSYKIAFQISDKIESNQYFKVSGTAWSWYYKKNSDFLYDWYLMTNFHVVNEVIAYSTGNSKIENNKWMYKDPTQLLTYHASNMTTKYDISKNYFDLATYSDDKGYNSLIYANKEDSNNHEQAISNQDVVKEVNIITDFNNNNVDLFSKSNQTNNVLYNLDMALVKISMDFSNKKDYLKTEHKRQNIFETYNSNAEEYKKNKYNPLKGVSIGGHPASEGKLIAKDIDSAFELREIPIISYDQILYNLKAPYYISETPQPNFLLTGGASGSAVYQLNNSSEKIDWTNIIPVGIYWGGFATNTTNPFHNFLPSIIPIIVNNEQSTTYNIFENFKNIINVL